MADLPLILNTDKFDVIQTKINDAITELNVVEVEIAPLITGQPNQLFIGTTDPNVPAFADYWGATIVFGDGVGPIINSPFGISSTPANRLRFRKSDITGECEIAGLVTMVGSSGTLIIADDSSVTIGVLPSGYTPSTLEYAGVCNIKQGSGTRPVLGINVLANGNIILTNRTGQNITWQANSYVNINIKYNLGI